MPSSDNIIKGAIKVIGLPDEFCYEDMKSLILDLPKILGLQIPETITNVIVSNTQPLSGQADSVWFRVSNGGAFIGIYMFSGGAWVQVFPAPGQVTWVYGDSASPPAGYILTDNSTAISLAIRNHLKSFWFPIGSGPWSYFSIVPAAI